MKKEVKKEGAGSAVSIYVPVTSHLHPVYIQFTPFLRSIS